MISCGDGEVTNAFTVTDSGIVSNPTGDQDITFIATHQRAAAEPVCRRRTRRCCGTNTRRLRHEHGFGGQRRLVTLGMTNQWHFYVVTNNALDSNGSAATSPTPRSSRSSPTDAFDSAHGRVCRTSQANATRPEADIDLYVTHGSDADEPESGGDLQLRQRRADRQSSPAGANGVFNGASLGRGGTEFVVDTNSTPGQVYYIGVKSEDQMASEYAFLSHLQRHPVQPAERQRQRSRQRPAGAGEHSRRHAGESGAMKLSSSAGDLSDSGRRRDRDQRHRHQNFGDLYGTLTHSGGGGAAKYDVLNNHSFFSNPSGIYPLVYDDPTTSAPTPSTTPTALGRAGQLANYLGDQGFGAWS